MRSDETLDTRSEAKDVTHGPRQTVSKRLTPCSYLTYFIVMLHSLEMLTEHHIYINI